MPYATEKEGRQRERETEREREREREREKGWAISLRGDHVLRKEGRRGDDLQDNLVIVASVGMQVPGCVSSNKDRANVPASQFDLLPAIERDVNSLGSV